MDIDLIQKVFDTMKIQLIGKGLRSSSDEAGIRKEGEKSAGGQQRFRSDLSEKRGRKYLEQRARIFLEATRSENSGCNTLGYFREQRVRDSNLL